MQMSGRFKRMSARWSLIISVTLLSTTSLADELTTAGDPESLGFSAARLTRIGAWYQSRTAPADLSGRDPGDLSGAVIAIAKNGKLAYLQATGFQDRSRTVPMKTDSIFWIASMTKPVTSVAAMMLVDDGKLELDAPVERYLPELKNMQVGAEETAATGTAEIGRQPAKRAMTIRDLLRHTSGLVYPPQYVDGPINRLYRKAAFARDKTLADFVASLAGLPLAHQPGEVFEYSWSVDVLARIIELASSQPFDEFLASRIFKPLRMVDTGFYVPKEKLHRLVEAPEPRNPQFDVTRPRKLLSGGGGLVSTATDYLRFCQMLLNGGELDGVRLLNTKSVQLMTSDALSPDVRLIGGAIGPALGSSFGLGFAVRTNAEFSNVPGAVGSYRWSGLWGTYFWIDPVEKMIAVQMIQVKSDKAGPYYAAIRNLTYGALRVTRPERLANPISAIALSTDTLASYRGKYDFGASSSSRDKMNIATSRFAGIGADIELASSAVKIRRTLDNSPAAAAGLHAGDLITSIDDEPVKGLSVNQVIGRLRGAIDTQVRLQVLRDGQVDPVQIAVTRAPIYVPGVELQVRADSGKLTVEATGPWPVLDFEKGKPVALTAISNSEFQVDDRDHTRITFVKDALGKVAGAILNPGPWEQRGVRVRIPPS
jgi:CubicO group peptidase (beta-lactamase class C family)